MVGSLNSNKLIIKFRYLTLAFSTFLFFISQNKNEVIWSNLTTIGCLLVSNIILMYLFGDKTLTEKEIALLITIDAFGMIIIFNYSGMTYSYYTWMLLNPVLASLIKLKDKKIKNYIMLVMSVILISILLLNKNCIQFNIRFSNTRLFFSFAIILFFSLGISKVLAEQEMIKEQLELSKISLEKTIEINKEITNNIIASIELVERMAIVDDYEQMDAIVLEFLNAIIKDAKTFCARSTSGEDMIFQGDFSEVESKMIMTHLIETNGHVDIKEVRFDLKRILIFHSIEYRGVCNYFGILFSNEYEINEIKQQLIFIQKLYKIILSKIKLQELRTEFLISKEQNRIAEEMHDNVNQQIFAVSCLAFNIKQKLEAMNYLKDTEMRNMIEQLYNYLTKINKDIKNIVYRMSLEKENKENIKVGLEKYIEELTFIYNIKINHSISEGFINLNSKLRNAVFRILNETISNSVRHGKSSLIDVNISVDKGNIKINISDNGVGFNISKLESKKRGLGIYSMEKLTEINKGSFEITSEINKGTSINLVLVSE